MRHSKENIERVSETIRKEGVQFLNLQFTDILGVVKSVGIPVEVFPDVLDHGLWFDGSSVQGFARIAESEAFDYLDAPILRLGGAESPIPYNPQLEKAAVPQVPGIIEGLRNLVTGRT